MYFKYSRYAEENVNGVLIKDYKYNKNEVDLGELELLKISIKKLFIMKLLKRKKFM